MTRVLLVSLEPEVVDYSDPALPPGMDAKKIHAGIELGLKLMTDRGWQADACLIQPDATGVPAVERRLGGTTYDCIVIGAGVRLPPKNLLLFETIINCAKLRLTPQSRSIRYRRIVRTPRLVGCPPLIRRKLVSADSVDAGVSQRLISRTASTRSYSTTAHVGTQRTYARRAVPGPVEGRVRSGQATARSTKAGPARFDALRTAYDPKPTFA
jgi:hypothetical protein